MNQIKYILTSLLFISYSLTAQITVKPSKIYLEKELQKSFENATEYSQIMGRVNSLDTSRYEAFNNEFQALKSRDIESFAAFQQYTSGISKINWLKDKAKRKHYEKVLFDFLDQLLEKNESKKREILTEIQTNIVRCNKTIGYSTRLESFLSKISAEFETESELSTYILEILDSPSFSFEDYRVYDSKIRIRKEELAYHKKLIDYTNSLIRLNTDYDGFYIQQDDSQLVEVLPSAGSLCHYVTGRFGLYFNYPKRWFTQEENVSLVSSVKKVILKGANFNDKVLPMAQFIKIDRKALGSHFLHCGNKLYKKGHAYIGMVDEKKEPITLSFKKKSISANHSEYYFPDDLSSGWYALFIEDAFYLFKIR